MAFLAAVYRLIAAIVILLMVLIADGLIVEFVVFVVGVVIVTKPDTTRLTECRGRTGGFGGKVVILDAGLRLIAAGALCHENVLSIGITIIIRRTGRLAGEIAHMLRRAADREDVFAPHIDRILIVIVVRTLIGNDEGITGFNAAL